MADTPKERNVTSIGTGIRPERGSRGNDGAWRIGPAYDESGGAEGTENLYLSSKYRDRGDRGAAAGRAISERMIGYTRRGNREGVDQIKGEGSIWRTALIGAPALVGAAIAGSRIWTNRSSFPLGSLLDDLGSQGPSFIQGFAAKYTPASIHASVRAAQEASLDSLSRGGISGATIEKMWGAAKRVKDPRGVVSGALQYDPDPLKSIQIFQQRFGDRPAAQSVFRNFLRRLRARTKYADMPYSAGFTEGPGALTTLTKLSRQEFLAQEPQLGGMLQGLMANKGLDVQIKKMTTMGRPGALYQLGFEGEALGGLKVRIPVYRTLAAEEASALLLDPKLAPGLAMTGASQHTLRAVGTFAELEGTRIKSTLKYDEFSLRRAFEKVIIPLMENKNATPKLARQLTKDWREEMLGYGKIVEGAGVGLTPQTRLLATARASEYHLFGPSGAALEGKTIREFLLANEDFFPAGSPKSAGRSRATVSSMDLSKLAPFGEIFPSEKRPFQAVRPHTPSSAAAEAMQRSRAHRATAWSMTPEYLDYLGSEGAPRMRTAFVSSGVAEGAGFMTPSAARKLETVRNRTIQIADEINQQLLNNPAREVSPGNFRFDKPMTVADIEDIPGGVLRADPRFPKDFARPGERPFFPKGGLLGFDPSGKPILAKRGQRILGYEAIRTGTPMGAEGEEAIQATRLLIEETSKAGRTAKVFGVAKAELGLRSSKWAQEQFGKNVEVIVSIDNLVKNRSWHTQQMITSLWDLLDARMRAPFPENRPSGMAAAFARDPGAFSKQAGAFLAKGEGAKERWVSLIHSLVGMGREGALGPREMGEVFGAVPAALDIKAENAAGLQEALKKYGLRFTLEEAEQLQKGVATGIVPHHPGGPWRLAGAGAPATIEPRMFELLSGPQYGELGPALRQELGERVLGAAPELATEQQQLHGVLAGMLGEKPGVSFADLPAYKLSQLTPEMLKPGHESFIGKAGARIGMEGLGGLGEVVLPSPELVPALRATSPQGTPFESSLMKDYLSFLEAARATKAGQLTAQQFQRDDIPKFQTSLWEAYSSVLTGRRRGIAARRGIPGARALGVVPTTGMLPPGELAAGIAEKRFFKMLGELRKQGYDSAALEEMKTRFTAGGTVAGEAIGGGIWRHPAFGPYSFQPTAFYKADVGINEILIEQQLENLFRVGEGGKRELLRQIDIGPAAGMAGDWDADVVNAVLLSPKTEKRALALAQDPAYIQQYREFAMKRQVLLAAIKKGEEGGVTLRQAMTAGAAKLGTAAEEVGLVSDALAEARAATVASKLSDRAKMDALTTLDLLEQTPIAGKHLSAKGVLSGEFEALFKRMSTAARGGTKGEIEEMLAGIFGKSTGAAREIIDEGLAYQIGRGGKVEKAGLKLGDVAQDLATALLEFRKTGDQGLSPARYRRMLFASRAKSFKTTGPEIAAAMKMEAEGVFSAFTPRLEQGTAAKAIRVAQTVRNRAAAMGGNLLKVAGKPLALGFGASVGLAMLLSKPVSNLEPGASASPSSGILKGGGSGRLPTPESLHPDPGVSGEPSPPNLPGPNRSFISPGATTNRIAIRSKMSGTVDYDALAENIRQRLPGRSSVNVRLNDRRTSLTEHRVSDILNR